jgi:hypothetical protein
MPCPFFAKHNVPTSYQEIGATETFQWSTKAGIAAIKLWRYDFSPSLGCGSDSRHQMEREMESETPTIIDLDAAAEAHDGPRRHGGCRAPLSQSKLA